MQQTTHISREVIAEHFGSFFPTLKKYPDSYVPKVFQNPEQPPSHFAYLCPLCLLELVIVVENHGLFMSTDFSMDHFPPASVGGKNKLMVCKKCNNDAGRDYDHSLKQKIKDLAFYKKIPNASLESRNTIEKVTGHYPGKLSINDEGIINLDFKPYRINAPFLDQWMNDINTNDSWEAKLNVKFANEHLVSKALMKTTYLSCFLIWGYDFAFSQSGQFMRDVMAGNADYPAPAYWLDESTIHNPNVNIPFGLCKILQPVKSRSFLVNMILTDESTSYTSIASVLVPGPTKQDQTDLAKLYEELVLQNNVTLYMEHVQLSAPTNGENLYERAWKELNTVQ